MNTIELQNNLIKRILNLKDTALLEYLDNALSSTETLIKVPAPEKQLLDKSEKDFKNGNIISNEEVRKEISGWLEE
jgi:hypothetical protein